MPSYSTVAILYILLQISSLLLLPYLMLIILRSEPYFTKWTLFQICLSAFGIGLTNTPLIIIYGDQLISRAFESPLCIILQKISFYLIIPFTFLSGILAFYLWYALIKRDFDIEKKCFWHVSITIWILSTIYSGIMLKLSSEEANWGVFPGILNCKTTKLTYYVYAYIIPTSIIDIVAIFMTCHTAIILHKRWSHFSNYKNRTTAIRLGEAVRLCVWCFAFVIILTIPLVNRFIQGFGPINSSNFVMHAAIMANLCQAGTGTVLFLVFGTNRKAAIFLPCCYYLTPYKSQRSQPQPEPPILLSDDLTLTNDNHELTQLPDAYLKNDIKKKKDDNGFMLKNFWKRYP